MTTLAEIRCALKAQNPLLAEKYGVTVVGVFGSYVRGEQRPDSDLDLLIEVERPARIGLMGLVELEQTLSDMLGMQVNAAIRENLKPRIGEHILQEVVAL
jgi:predicted nucleotidyltransferase